MRTATGGAPAIYGMPRGDLSRAGAPSGQTLGQDPLVSALANCLGDVVAAEFVTGYHKSVLKPAAVAVGVSRPASNARDRRG